MHIYAVEEVSAERLLVALECDSCGVRIKPSTNIVESGWKLRGQDKGPGTEKITCHYCPSCSEQFNR